MRILIVDDHQLIRSGLRDLLSGTFAGAEIIEADTGAKALELAIEKPFDLAVVDLFVPGEAAFIPLRKLCDQNPELPVLVLSASENSAHMRKCIDFGASAYVTKSAPQASLLKAVKTILAGGVSFPPLSDRPPNYPTESPDISLDTVTDNLTGRQMEILTMVAQGKSNKQIARECDLSDNTVKVHVSAILRSLGLSNRTQIGVLGQRLGLAPSGAELASSS